MNQAVTQKCLWCDESFITKYEYQKYCQDRHRAAAKKWRKSNREKLGTIIYHYRSMVYVKTCEACDQPFVDRYNNKKTCSNVCKEIRKRTNARARLSGIGMTKKTAKQKLYWIANGKCQLCKEPIDLERIYPDHYSFSIDHIIPLSRGGTNAISNLQATHWICNVNKGSRLVA